MGNRNKLHHLLLGLLLILITACDTPPVKKDTTAIDAIAAAKTANKLAIKENYEWRDTRKLIKKAEKALASGKDSKAIKLANQAQRQAENAVKQKKSELKRLQHMFDKN
jgi:hypothetical protein